MDLYWPEHEEDFRLEEWRKHGRGTGMTPEEYFATVMDIHQAILNIVGEDGINLDSGVPIKARDAVESLKKKLGRVQISTFKSVEEEDTTNYIGELKIYIDKDSYGIGSRPNMSSYLGITSKDEVVLPKAPVKLKKKKRRVTKSFRSSQFQSNNNGSKDGGTEFSVSLAGVLD